MLYLFNKANEVYCEYCPELGEMLSCGFDTKERALKHADMMGLSRKKAKVRKCGVWIFPKGIQERAFLPCTWDS